MIVRHARRRRGPGRDAGHGQGLPRPRRVPRCRRDRDRRGAGSITRSRGETKLVAQEVEVFRADRGRGRQGARRPGHRAAASSSIDAAAVRRLPDRGAEGDLRALPWGHRGVAGDGDARRVPAGCGSGATTAYAARPPWTPSSTPCSAPDPARPRECDSRRGASRLAPLCARAAASWRSPTRRCRAS